MAHLRQTLFGIFTLATFAAGIGPMSAPAQAGFQFSPAPKAGVAAPAPAAGMPDNGPLMPMLPAGKVETDTLNQMPSPPLPAPPADPMASGENVTEPHVLAAPISARASAAPGQRTSSSLPDAVGFGSDLPLVLGMRQIIPAQYAYAFDSGVDKGAKISWNGGKPWDIALNEALKPLGYTAVVEGNTVHVSSGASASGAMAVPTPPAAPVAAPPVMAAHAGGDMPRPPLSPTAEAPADAPAAPVLTADSAKPVNEVYIRRNADGAAVEKRSAGQTEVSTAKNDVVLTDDGDKPGFWERANPMNWNKDTGVTEAPVYNVSRSSSETPAPPAADVGPVARMSDNDAKIAAGNTGAEAHIPNAPGDVADAAPAASGPVMLTRGPGEVSREAPPADPIEKEAVAAPVPTADVLNNGEVTKWEAQKGDSLKTVLQQWSEKAKVQLYWVPAQDYKLPKPVSMTGNYTDAVSDVLSAYGDKGSRPVGRLHPNLPNGPSVLIIEPASS
ncbi:MAG: hypothetical protein JWO78_1446 [Micavibrio sp.]|nr:hypothetical protein [Micavibrio sp.]